MDNKHSKSNGCILKKKRKKKNRPPEIKNNENDKRQSMKSETIDENITKTTLNIDESLDKYSSDSDCDTNFSSKIMKSSSISLNKDAKVIKNTSIESEETKNKIYQSRRNFFKELYKTTLNEDKRNFVEYKNSEAVSRLEINNSLKSKRKKQSDPITPERIDVKEFENGEINPMEIDKAKISTDQLVERKLQDPFEKFNNELFLNQIANNYVDIYMCGRGFDQNLPIGFANRSVYCYLNCVVQVIVSCQNFIKDIEAYDKWDNGETNENTIFVRGLFDLIRALKKRKHGSAASALKTIQIYITESSFGDDVYRCFMNILNHVNNVTKQELKNSEQIPQTKPVTSKEKANFNFKRLESRNHGLVFNNFYGQITFQTICKKCNKICNESFQMIKSLLLLVPKTEHSTTLEDCIKLFLNESDVELDDPMKCDCLQPTFELKSVTKITHSPKYLFIYLNRGSYNEDGEKNETTVTCDHTIEIETTTGLKKYQLISVIDRIRNSSYGHYYCKCNYETYNWYLLNDTQVDSISRNEVITKQSIVFLFKQL